MLKIILKQCFNKNIPFEVDIRETNDGVLVCCHNKGDECGAPHFSSIIPYLMDECILDIKEGVRVKTLRTALKPIQNIKLNIQFNEFMSPKIYDPCRPPRERTCGTLDSVIFIYK